MKRVIYLLFALLSQNVFSQSVQEKIDEQVWRPFTKAWESNDGTLYNSIHTDDVWRINPGRLLIGEEYKSQNRERMQGQEKESIIEFTFETRTNNGNNAYEVGYYRITSQNEAGIRYFVGRFHVALKKIDGVWKIAQDWDTDEINGEQITPKSLTKRDFIHFD